MLKEFTYFRSCLRDEFIVPNQNCKNNYLLDSTELCTYFNLKLNYSTPLKKVHMNFLIINQTRRRCLTV